MQAWQNARTLLQRILAMAHGSDPDAPGYALGASDTAVDGPAPPLPATGHAPRGELHELLDEVGAVAPSSQEAAQAERQQTVIAELRRMLEALQPLGEELAAAERARAAAQEHIGALDVLVAALEDQLTLAAQEVEVERRRAEDLERALAAALAASRAAEIEAPERAAARERELATLARRCERLERALAAREGVLARERQRHRATRARLAEQRRDAAERGRELARRRTTRKRGKSAR